MAGSGQSTSLYSSQISSPTLAYFPRSSHDLPAYTPSPLTGSRSDAPSYQSHLEARDRNDRDPIACGSLVSPALRGFERLEREAFGSVSPIDPELIGGVIHPHFGIE